MKYKTYEELKEELGDKFEEYMYGANINLLTKIDKAIELIENVYGSLENVDRPILFYKNILNILKGADKE